MTVKEMIKALQKQNPQAEVYVATKDEDYPFTPVSSVDFENLLVNGDHVIADDGSADDDPSESNYEKRQDVVIRAYI